MINSVDAIIKKILLKIFNIHIFDFKEKEFVCYKRAKGLLIVSKKFIQNDYFFAKEYIDSFIQKSKNYNVVDVSDAVYEKYLNLLKKGETCWKYNKRFGKVIKVVICSDKTLKLVFKSEILGGHDFIESEFFLVKPEPYRLMIEGKNLCTYLSKIKLYKFLLSEVTKYIEFLFLKYQTQNPNIIQGKAIDAVPTNCVLTKDKKYNLFDLEFELKNGVCKSYMIYMVCSNLEIKKEKQIKLFYDCCRRFNFKASWEDSEKLTEQIWDNLFKRIDSDALHNEDEDLFNLLM